jgi:hypothetical protein
MVLSGCFKPILRSSCLEAIAVFGEIDRVGLVPRIGAPSASSSGCASFSGVWPPNCTITPCTVPRDFSVDDLEHVFGVSGSK